MTARAATPTAHAAQAPFIWCLLALAAHVPLGAALAASSTLATLHAGVALAVGLACAALSREGRYAAYAAAYITGGEVLWRMTGAGVPWEFGKVAVSLVLLTALARRWSWRGAGLPIAYFALLLPSALVTLAEMPGAAAREQLSFNLAGPFALAVSAWFFGSLRVGESQRLRILLSLAAPTMAVAAVASVRMSQVTAIDFTTESNFAASGGFPPNQVAAALGFGALAVGLLALSSGKWAFRVPMAAALLALAAQSAITFSRGGLYMAAGGLLAAAVFMIREPRALARVSVVVVAAALLSYAIIFPRLERLTGGMLAERFRDTGTSGRSEIVVADLQIWGTRPVAGVGPGGATALRERLVGKAVAAHVEFSRLLAEHGLFGVAALIVMAAMGLRAMRRADSSGDRGLAAAMLTWSVLFMLTTGTRLVAPSFAFGLAAVRTDSRKASRRDDRAASRGYRRVA